MQIRFIYNEPAAIFGEWIVISDLHIGSPLSPNWKVVAGVVDELMTRERKNRLLILGDVKDKVAESDADVGRFIREIGSRYDLHICKGNHDGRIEKYSKYCTVYGPGGTVIDNVGFLHGHAWPDKKLLKCRTIAVGHSHPAYLLRSKRSSRVWIIGRLSVRSLREHYGKNVKIARGIRVIVFPSFCETYKKENDENNLGPLLQEHTFIRKSATIYLLNGIRVR